jgi:outer membrane protein TolC
MAGRERRRSWRRRHEAKAGFSESTTRGATSSRERALRSGALAHLGRLPSFEVLEAQQQLYPAQSVLAQIRRDRLLSHVRLYKALGGGWSLTDVQWQDQVRRPETGQR